MVLCAAIDCGVELPGWIVDFFRRRRGGALRVALLVKVVVGGLRAPAVEGGREDW